MKKKIYIFFTLLIIFFLILSSVVIFNTKLRNNFVKSIIPAYNIFQNLSIRSDFRTRNFASMSQRISNQIELSKKFGKNKTAFASGIYDNMSLAFSLAITRSDYQNLKKLAENLIEIDPRTYMAHVWFAQANAMVDNSVESIKKSIFHINKAIKISSVREEAYRVGIKIMSQNNILSDELASLCSKYFTSQSGGIIPRTHRNFLIGLGLRKMAIFFENEKDFIPNFGIQLNEDIEYEFNLNQKKNFESFGLILATLPGLKITLNKILLSSNNEKITLSSKDLIINTKSSYLFKNNEDTIEIVTQNNAIDEIIYFNFKEKFENIESISIEMKFERMPLGPCKI